MIRHRHVSFWILMAYLVITLLLLLSGQTMAIIDYDLAVSLGLQESVSEVSPYGVEVNRAFGAADTFIYVPLTLLSIVGILLKKRWAMFTTAAVMGISAYWSTMVGFMLIFLEDVQSYHLEPGMAYWVVLGFYAVSGIVGLIYIACCSDRIMADDRLQGGI